MPYEKGGRADKDGNIFEYNYIIERLLDIIEEKIDYITIEPIGSDEVGVDVIVFENGIKSFQQCKGRNGSKEIWTYGDVNAKDIFKKWQYHLERDSGCQVALVSPLVFTLLIDLTNLARTTGNSVVDFINYQIEKSSKEVKALYYNICAVWGLDVEINKNIVEDESLESTKYNDINKSIDYLSRIYYKQVLNFEFDYLKHRIGLNFVGTHKEIYNSLYAFVNEPSRRAKKIDLIMLEKYFKLNNIEYKNLEKDTRVLPFIREVNEKFINSFNLINESLIDRDVFYKCFEAIVEGSSLVIHGKAGMGKSSCVLSITEFCEDNAIPYIGIRLDKYTPEINLTKWSETLGAPDTLTNCINSISKNRRAVIILDQLDALRWTQSHSSTSIDVCYEIIREVERLNKNREVPISLVFVTRTFDLKNDRGIKKLLDKNEKRNFEFKSFEMGNLKEDDVKKIVGNSYGLFTNKFKELLSIPSNLYIWTHLDKCKLYEHIDSSSDLVNEWWKQLEYECESKKLNSCRLIEIKNKMVEITERRGTVSINKILLNNFENIYFEFLQSSGFINIENDNISFVHQSLIDTFLAENMIKAYYENESSVNIKKIVGSKENQTPIRRFQFQLFMERLLNSTYDFVRFSQILIYDNEIRSSFKFVCFEILHELVVIDEVIEEFVINGIKNDNNKMFFINNVVWGNSGYINILLNAGFINEWFSSVETKQYVFNLIYSLEGDFSEDLESFIISNLFKNDIDDIEFITCINHNIANDSDDFFINRINLYKKHSSQYHKINIYRLINDSIRNTKKVKEINIDRLLEILKIFIQKPNDVRQHDVTYILDRISKNLDDSIMDKSKIINIMLSIIPKDIEYLFYSEWSDKNYSTISAERKIVEIIKSINTIIAKDNPNELFLIYKDYMGKGYLIYNEIILHFLSEMQSDYSDEIIQYLCSSFDSNVFEVSSGKGNKLYYTKLIIRQHSINCSKENFDLLERTIYDYTSPNIYERYKWRIEYSKREKVNVYWSYWGDLQYELLKELPLERTNDKTKELVRVLDRKFPKGTTSYKLHYGQSGGVTTPISNKKLSLDNWHSIVTNKKFIGKNRNRDIYVEGNFVSSDLEDMARVFEKAVRNEPEKYIKLFLNSKEPFLEAFIYMMLLGVASSESLDNLQNSLIQKLFYKIYNVHNLNENIYRSLLEIIYKKKDVKWDDFVIENIVLIIENYKDESNDINKFQNLLMYSDHMVKCKAIKVLGLFIKDNNLLFQKYKQLIIDLSKDESEVVRFAIFCLVIENIKIDEVWIDKLIIELINTSFRFIGYLRIWFIKELFIKNKEELEKAITSCFFSDDEDLINQSISVIISLNFHEEGFIDFFDEIDINVKNSEIILMKLIKYFGDEKYNKKVKEIILRFKNIEDYHFLSSIFYDNMIIFERDSEFLLEVYNSKLGENTLSQFYTYLKDNNVNLLKFSDIIFSACLNLIESYDSKSNKYFDLHAVSELILFLYDGLIESKGKKEKEVITKCLDLWDLMYEKNIGVTRTLSKELMDR